MKTKVCSFFIVLSILFCVFSCASSSSEEENILPIVEGSETTLPVIPKKSTYFEFSDASIMQDAEKGSPVAIKNVVSKIRKANGKYTEEEAVLLAVLHTVLTNVWPSETVNFQMPDSLPENVYTGIIDYINKGIFDTNAGKTDFYTLVLPCVILCNSTQISFYTDAEKNLLEALAKNSNSVVAHYLLGVLYKNQGDINLAKDHFEKAYELDSSCFEVGLEYAKTLYNTKSFQKAFDIAISLNNPEGSNIELLKLCAATALATNQIDVAEVYVDRLLQKEPDSPSNILLRAEILFEKEDYLRVSSLLDVYSKTDSTSVKYLLLRSKLQYLWNRNTTAAVNTISEALSLYPNDYDVILFAAELASETGNLINGKTAFELAAPIKETDANNPKLMKIEVEEYIRKEDWKNAFAISEKLLEIDSSVDFQIAHIRICVELGKFSAAYEIASQLMENYGDNEDAQLIFVEVLIAQNEKDKAREIIDSLINGASSKMKSALYYQKSKIETNDEKKLSNLRSSLTANPRNEDALFSLYELYFKKNDYRKAKYYLKQVIALNPNNEELLRLNSELENFLY